MSFTRTLRAVGGAAVAGALLFGTASVASADQMRNDQWPLQKFDAESVWKVSTGKGVTVAVIDDPVDGSHADLVGNVLPGKSFIDGGTADHAYQQRAHGTAMASLIAGHGHGPGGSDGVKGLAPDAKILPVGTDEGSSDFSEPLRYAVDQGAKVVNMSFVTGSSELTPLEQKAVEYARQHDVLLVAGTGNDGVGTPAYPAAAPGVLAVGAVDSHGYVWDKSNFGPYVKLLAPGVRIRSASPVVDVNGKYRLANGTSDSTAYVSATAALLRSKFPDLTAGQIANRMIKTAGIPVDMPDMKLPDQHYGYGFIKPLSALTKDVPAGPKDGPFPALSGGGASSDPSSAAGNNGVDPKIHSSKGLSPVAIIGIVGGVLVVLVIVLVVVLVAKKKRNGPPPGGPGGFGGPGGPGGFVPNPQGPQGAYQQRPGGPGSYPQMPPTQPPGR
ncbi:S8 family peptidase [Streptomyces lunalinharesii]|uniref:Type VII secretion-associated serine protease mycosin n=1 Tax=Streptomyces lunalinharesii TaxID=333384 RepID=A0ABN3RGP0_9ACTN